MNKREEKIINITKRWIEKFIIRYEICPFAKHSFTHDKIIYRVEDAATYDSFLFALANFLRELTFQNNKYSNAFLILPSVRFGFAEFYNLVEESSHLLAEMSLEETFQLVAFHPDFQYEDSEISDPTNLTNRSPYAMVHVLQITEVTKAIDNHGNTMAIPIRNMRLLESMKAEEINEIINLMQIIGKNID